MSHHIIYKNKFWLNTLNSTPNFGVSEFKDLKNIVFSLLSEDISMLDFEKIYNEFVFNLSTLNTSSGNLKILLLNQQIFDSIDEYINIQLGSSVYLKNSLLRKISDLLNFIKKNEYSQSAYRFKLSTSDLNEYLNRVSKLSFFGKLFGTIIRSFLGLSNVQNLSVSEYSKYIWGKYVYSIPRQYVDFFQVYKFNCNKYSITSIQLKGKLKAYSKGLIKEIKEFNELRLINNPCTIEKIETEQINNLLVDIKKIKFSFIKQNLSKKYRLLDFIEVERRNLDTDFNLKILFDTKNQIIFFRFNHNIIDGVFARRFCIYFLEKLSDKNFQVKSKTPVIRYNENLPTNTLITEFLNKGIQNILPDIQCTFQVNQAEIGGRVSPRTLNKVYSFVEQKIAKIGVPSMWLVLWANVSKLNRNLLVPFLNIFVFLGLIKFPKNLLFPTIVISSQGLFKNTKQYEQVLASTGGDGNSVLNISYTFIEESKKSINIQVCIEKGANFGLDRSTKNYLKNFNKLKNLLSKQLVKDFKNIHSSYPNLFLSFN